MKTIVSGGIPTIDIHFPPNILLIGLLKRSAIRYILGTTISVIKNADINPNIIVQANGFQNDALSPPIHICGSRCSNIDTKLILKPTPNGINPNIAARAVSITGMIRVLPACITASRVFNPLDLNSSANSITRIPFFTTIPARPTTPNPVIAIETSIPVKANPKKNTHHTKNYFCKNNYRFTYRIKL